MAAGSFLNESVDPDQTGPYSSTRHAWSLRDFPSSQASTSKETFSPTPALPTIRYFLAQAVLLGLDIHLADVDTAYPIPKLPQGERAYMRLPDLPAELDLHVPADHVVELLKCLYGLKLSGRHWNQHLKLSPLFFGNVTTRIPDHDSRNANIHMLAPLLDVTRGP